MKLIFFFYFLLLINNSFAQFKKINLERNFFVMGLYSNHNFIQATTLKGLILTSEDNGISWTVDSTFKDHRLGCVFYIDSLTGFISGSGFSKALLKTENRGKSWKVFSETNIVGGGFATITYGDNRILITLGSQASFSFDKGITWKRSICPIEARDVYSFQFVNDSTGYLLASMKSNECLEGFVILQTIDSGQTFTTYSKECIFSTAGFVENKYGITKFVTDSVGFFMSDLKILKTKNAGLTFYSVANENEIQSGFMDKNERIAFIGKDTIFALFMHRLMYSFDQGEHWHHCSFYELDNQKDYAMWINITSNNKIIVGTMNSLYISDLKDIRKYNSIENLPNISNDIIIPSLFSNNLDIDFLEDSYDAVTISSIDGRKMIEVKGIHTKKVSIDTESLGCGIYIVTMTQGNVTKTVKVVKI
jgi:hypothetical protein